MTRIRTLVAAAACGLLAQAHAESSFRAGIELREQATAADVGLPAFPGARQQRDKDEDKAALRLDLWGGAYGFRLVVAKFAADAEPDQVASFYRAALAQFGPVLDCSATAPRAPAASSTAPGQLSCGDDRPRPGGQLYKAGTSQRQRVVSLQPAGPGRTHFQLVLVETKRP